jgi:hypothetical protein
LELSGEKSRSGREIFCSVFGFDRAYFDPNDSAQDATADGARAPARGKTPEVSVRMLCII